MTPQEHIELEAAQRARLREINTDPHSRAGLEQKYGQVWDSDELRRDFHVLSFAAPWVVVMRRADNRAGSLEFRHSPRLYFNFREDHGQ